MKLRLYMWEMVRGQFRVEISQLTPSAFRREFGLSDSVKLWSESILVRSQAAAQVLVGLIMCSGELHKLIVELLHASCDMGRNFGDSKGS